MPGPQGPRGPPIGLRPRPGGSSTGGISPETMRRVARGFGWGLVATLLMTLAVAAALTSQLIPLPDPVAVALVDNLVETSLSAPVLWTLAGALHLLYGGFWGAVLVLARDPVRPQHGLALAAGLWATEQLAVLPLAGWGMFARDLDPRLAAVMAVLHLIYGVSLGLLLAWRDRDRVSQRIRVALSQQS